MATNEANTYLKLYKIGMCERFFVIVVGVLGMTYIGWGGEILFGFVCLFVCIPRQGFSV